MSLKLVNFTFLYLFLEKWKDYQTQLGKEANIYQRSVSSNFVSGGSKTVLKSGEAKYVKKFFPLFFSGSGCLTCEHIRLLSLSVVGNFSLSRKV